VEDADLASAQELFGSNINLDAMQPKSAKDFEDFAAALINKYVAPHAKSAHYKTLVKAVMKGAVRPLDMQQTKDIETAVAGMRSEKLKEKAAAEAAKKCEPPLHLSMRDNTVPNLELTLLRGKMCWRQSLTVQDMYVISKTACICAHACHAA
jgi:hypothetical protein